MMLEINKFSDFDIVIDKIIDEKIKQENLKSNMKELIKKVFMIGFEAGKNGKSIIIIDK